MPAPRDYYNILGVKRGASADEIRSAYRGLARELHPDVNQAADAAQRFGEVQEAYDVLSDDAKRKQYDSFGRAGASPFGAGAAGRGPTYAWTNVAGSQGGGADFDLGSMFEEILRGGSAGDPFAVGFGTPAQARSRPARGKDIRQDFAIDFTTAALGGTRSLRVRRGGSTQTIEVTIPKGINEGAKLRIRGAGSPSPGGAPPGDLILTVHIAPHPYFRREGAGLLLLTLPISVLEASLGTVVHVPTFTGKRAELTVPPGTASGTRLRLKAQGLKAGDAPPGDLLVEIKIVAPSSLDERDKAILEDVATRLPKVRDGEPWID